MEIPFWFRRFWAKIAVRPWDCWEWTASLRKDGYGRFGIKGVIHTTHVVSYTLLVAPVPSGLTLDHLCRNRKCVNPDHLEIVTRRVNILRGNAPAAINARKTHCNNGHPLEGDNLYTDAKGKRRCKFCTKANDKCRNYKKKDR